MSQVRVNIRSLLNTAAVREEVRHGRKVMVVPSATLPDNIIMNGIRYPAEEIGKSYLTLNRTPAPCGHPMLNGQYASAFDPEASNHVSIGAWNENARRESGRVLLDKVIDIEVANQSEKGRAVLAAIKEGKPVHTSTGLNCEISKDETGAAEFVATNMKFDHDAILLNEPGAATPDEGVGMLVNGETIRVINSAIEWADRDLDYALGAVVEALDRREKAGFVDAMKARLLKTLGDALGFQMNKGDDPMDATEKKQIADLETKLADLQANQEKAAAALAETVTNTVTAALKPLLDAEAARVANAKAAEEAELADLRAKIVKANVMDEAGAGELTLNSARALIKSSVPETALGLNGAPITNAKDAFQPPKGDK